jgi:hypothetical protein
MIFISRNPQSLITSIVSAKDINSARAYWQGAKINHFMEETFSLEEDRENENFGYVTPILKTKETSVGNISNQTIIIQVISK